MPDFGHKKACVIESAAHAITLLKEEVMAGTLGCQRCQALPPPISDQSGVLSLRFPHRDTRVKVLDFLVDSPHRYEEQDGTLHISVEAGGILSLLSPMT